MAIDLTSYMASTGAEGITSALGISLGLLLIISVAIIILKGLALYKAARLKEQGWFWILLIFNTAGILPAIYLIIRRRRK